MSAKHTKGPWFVYRQPVKSVSDAVSEFADLCSGTKDIGVSLFMLTTEDRKCPAVTCGPSSEANAHLIAAAPELLQALECILSDEEVALSRPDYIQARAAIAKARGESND